LTSQQIATILANTFKFEKVMICYFLWAVVSLACMWLHFCLSFNGLPVTTITKKKKKEKPLIIAPCAPQADG